LAGLGAGREVVSLHLSGLPTRPYFTVFIKSQEWHKNPKSGFLIDQALVNISPECADFYQFGLPHLNGGELIKRLGLLLWSINLLRFYDYSLFIPRPFPSYLEADPFYFYGGSLLIPRLLPSYSPTVPLLFRGGSFPLPNMVSASHWADWICQNSRRLEMVSLLSAIIACSMVKPSK